MGGGKGKWENGVMGEEGGDERGGFGGEGRQAR